MLGKLMKYELRATSRIMLPGFAAVLALSGLTRLSTEYLAGRGGWLNAVSVIVTVLFVLSCMAVGLLALVLMIQRFRDNLLRDEGYLMHTLPVSTAQNIFAKLLTSVIWYFGTAVAGVLAVYIQLANARNFSGVLQWLREAVVRVSPEMAAQGFLFLLELILCATAGLSAFALVIYASMALGHRFQSHRGLMSVLIFFGINIATQIAAGTAGAGVTRLTGNIWRPEISAAAAVHLALLSTSAVLIIYGAVFYFITVGTLRRHLNLE